MWLRIPVELLAFNQGSGAGAGDGSGTGAGGSGGSGGTGTGGSDGKSGEGSGDGKGDDGKTGDDPAKPQGRTFTQAELDEIVKDRLAKEKRAAEARTENAKTEAAAQALKDNQKFEELAKTRETQLIAANGQIETLTAERDALTVRVTEADTAIATILTSQTKDLPPYIRPLLEKMTPAEQLTYLAANAEAIRKGSTQAVPNHSGSGTGAGSGGSGNGSGTGAGNPALSYIQSAYGRKDSK
jgi:hypothetical protein